jgi:signal transduction histidine kinase
MSIARDPAVPAKRTRLSWSTDNRFVRAVARLPLPLGAKLIAGFLIIGALLALVATLGLIALGRSNTRGEQLRHLQRRAVYVQLVLTDATQLQKTIEYRMNAPGSSKRFGSGLDQAIGNDMNQLCIDSGFQCLGAAEPTPFHLTDVDPKAFHLLATALPIFYRIVGTGTGPSGSVESVLRRADRFASSFGAQMTGLARRTSKRANGLVAADQSSFAHSRDVLIVVGAGSLFLALTLGALLSWSIVAPLRRAQERLSGIAAGDFTAQVEVPNRDEIGALAADVNRMNDELQRVYGELETASRHKSDFLATMSHELRTPLNAIIGFSEVLHEQMFGSLNERQLAYVEDVLEAGRHLLSLINDVLDLAKIEAGKMDLELAQVSLPELLRGAISMHSEPAGRGQLKLGLTSEPEEITVTADERRVRQIVFNLLSNAVKFTPPDGRVDVSARLDDGYVEIAVADTGPGIAVAELETIFEEFEQTADGRRADGTGLGLPLSRKLVELHGGRIWAESEVGRGSTFRFTIPSRGPVRQEAS